MLSLTLIQCSKELDGPYTNAPKYVEAPVWPTGPTGPVGPTGEVEDTINFGRLKIYTLWEDFNMYCDSVQVIVDGEERGYLTTHFDSEPQCGEKGTITVGGLEPGTHSVYIGKCGITFHDIKRKVLRGQCVPHEFK